MRITTVVFGVILVSFGIVLAAIIIRIEVDRRVRLLAQINEAMGK